MRHDPDERIPVQRGPHILDNRADANLTTAKTRLPTIRHSPRHPRGPAYALAVAVSAFALAPAMVTQATDAVDEAATATPAAPAKGFGEQVKRDAKEAGAALKETAHRVGVAAKAVGHEVATAAKRSAAETRSAMKGEKVPTAPAPRQ